MKAILELKHFEVKFPHQIGTVNYCNHFEL